MRLRVPDASWVSRAGTPNRGLKEQHDSGMRVVTHRSEQREHRLRVPDASWVSRAGTPNQGLKEQHDSGMRVVTHRSEQREHLFGLRWSVFPVSEDKFRQRYPKRQGRMGHLCLTPSAGSQNTLNLSPKQRLCCSNRSVTLTIRLFDARGRRLLPTHSRSVRHSIR